jgi:hypothetical protein
VTFSVTTNTTQRNIVDLSAQNNTLTLFQADTTMKTAAHTIVHPGISNSQSGSNENSDRTLKNVSKKSAASFEKQLHTFKETLEQIIQEFASQNIKADYVLKVHTSEDNTYIQGTVTTSDFAMDYVANLMLA